MSARLQKYTFSPKSTSDTQLPAVEIYVDGAALPENPGYGGAGIVVLVPINGERQRKAFGVYLGDEVTNNAAEISAAMIGLQELTERSQVALYSDSQYVINTMTKGWKKNANKELWAQLEIAANKHEVTWNWVRGHSGDEFNELAHILADQAAEEQRDVTEDEIPEQLQPDGETLTTLEDLLAAALSGGGLLTLGSESGVAFAMFQQPDGETINWRSRGGIDTQNPARSFFERDSLEGNLSTRIIDDGTLAEVMVLHNHQTIK